MNMADVVINGEIQGIFRGLLVGVKTLAPPL